MDACSLPFYKSVKYIRKRIVNLYVKIDCIILTRIFQGFNDTMIFNNLFGIIVLANDFWDIGLEFDKAIS